MCRVTGLHSVDRRRSSILNQDRRLQSYMTLCICCFSIESPPDMFKMRLVLHKLYSLGFCKLFWQAQNLKRMSDLKSHETKEKNVVKLRCTFFQVRKSRKKNLDGMASWKVQRKPNRKETIILFDVNI